MKRFFWVVLIVLITAGFAYASGGGDAEAAHQGRNWANFGWRTLNFVVLAGVLYWLVAKGIKGFFVGGREAIKAEMEEAKAARAEAKEKLKECSERLDKAAGEISEISEMIRAQGSAEKERIVKEAERAAEQIKADAQARSGQELKRAIDELRAEAADLAVELAEDVLKKKVRKTDHEIMVNDFLDKAVRLN